jgi:hypothetical protein
MTPINGALLAQIFKGDVTGTEQQIRFQPPNEVIQTW